MHEFFIIVDIVVTAELFSSRNTYKKAFQRAERKEEGTFLIYVGQVLGSSIKVTTKKTL